MLKVFKESNKYALRLVDDGDDIVTVTVVDAQTGEPVPRGNIVVFSADGLYRCTSVGEDIIKVLNIPVDNYGRISLENGL